MARDGDRHQLGDPISRMADDAALAVPSLEDASPPEALSERELLRELANLDVIVREAGDRGTPADLVAQARHRLRRLEEECRGRGITISPAG